MIYAYFNSQDKQIINFTLSGHAEAGPYGHDLVCAAVSALTIGTANNLSRLAEVEPEIDANEEDGGFVEIILPTVVDKKQQDTSTNFSLDHCIITLLDIQEEYGEFLSVSKTNNE